LSHAAEEHALFQIGAVTVSAHFFRPLAKLNSPIAEVDPHEVIPVSNPIQATQAVNAQAETPQAAQAPKNPQAATQTATPQDKVTISEPAKQALASSKNPIVKG